MKGKNVRRGPRCVHRLVVPIVLAGLAGLCLGLGSIAAAAPGPSPDQPAKVSTPKKLQRAIFIGNNWDGTADIINARGRFGRIAHINIVPDYDERMAEVQSDPVRLGYFLAVRELIGEGHDQLVDDMFSTNDGRHVLVSRPSFRDVVSIDLATGQLAWRFVVDGQRSDHMAISPDGKRLAVSASTGNVVHILDTATGAEVGRFPSGDSPHENNYSKDGKLIYHASIGLVYTPTDLAQLDTSKGKRIFEIVDAKTYEVLERIDMGKKLAEAGYPGMSSAVRPMTLSPDERYVYFQVSFFHGFVEYDFKTDRVTRVANLPISAEAQAIPQEQYVLDSAHHGIAMNPEGTKLCVAGTMSDYAAIVNRRSFKYKILSLGEKPYWATNSGDGKNCLVSFSGDDSISVISYETAKEIARVPVGDHPQRIRNGVVRKAWIDKLRALRSLRVGW